MIDVGGFNAMTCGGRTRRSFLRAATAAPFLWSAANGPFQAAEADRVARAKSVILIWLWGGPSHIDMVDPKPQAPIEYRGPFGTIPTKTPGVHFTELLPRMAARTDRFTLIRSMQSSNDGHPGAGTVGLTGYEEAPDPVQPNFGSIVSKHTGQRGTLPPFFYVGRGIPRDLPRRIEGYGGGTLGKAYDPFLVSCSAAGEVGMSGLELLPDMTPLRMQDRKQLISQLDVARRHLDAIGVQQWNHTNRAAYDLLTQPGASRAFDLTEEKQSTRDNYGRTTFGQGCLLARRLVEANVPYIQVNWSEYVETFTPNADWGWDTHIYNFELLQDRHCPIFDRAFSALVDDLHERGLFEDTLLVAVGEFGRSPKINYRSARDHWPKCYFSIWSGAGIEPGHCIGESDARGEEPLTRPITPLMMGTTIAELCGMSAQHRAEMRVLDGGSLIDELL